VNRRNLVLGAGAASLAAFGGAAWYVSSRQAAPEPVLAADSPLLRPHAPVLGPEDAPVTIVEFFDPACEACRAFYPVVEQIMEAFPGQVRTVLRYAAFHEGSDEAVRILEAARLQGKFEEVLQAVLDAQPEWATHDGPNLDAAWAAAERAGLDLEQARVDRLRPEITAVLNQDAADVAAIGVRKTPTFFVSGKPLSEFGAQQLYDQVAAEVASI
jgi:protein-disulfide isomerase